MVNEKLIIYMELDIALDTRLPLLYEMDEDVASKVVMNGYYDNRVRDEFEHISGFLFKNLYKLRNKKILTNALPTRAFEVLKIIVAENSVNKKYTMSPDLIINVYPYKLLESEQEALINSLATLYKGITIKTIYRPHSNVTPEWIYSEDIEVLFMYDYEWLENQNKLYNLTNYPLLDRTLYVPALIKGKIEDKITNNTFNDIRHMISPNIRLEFISSFYVNGIIKKE